MKMFARVLPVTIAAAFVIVGVATADPSYRGIEPVTVSGKVGCSDLANMHSTRSVKFDSPVTGESGGIVIILDGDSILWYVRQAPETAVEAVIVKGGPYSNVYRYPYPAQHWGDSGLVPPTNPKNGKRYGLGFVEFCYSIS